MSDESQGGIILPEDLERNIIGMQGRVFHEVKTLEQARSFVLHHVQLVEQARDACNVRVPGDEAATARLQTIAYDAWRLRYGRCVGVMEALMACRILNDVAWEQLRARLLATGKPSIMGEV